MSNFEKLIADVLRKSGYKATPQRIAICKTALQNRTHPTAKEIYNKVKKDYPTISLATVYKTLRILQELNLLQELPFWNGRTRFDPYMKPHINLVCLKCGAIRDLDDPIIRTIIDNIRTNSKFTVTSQRLDIYGLCEKCRSSVRQGSFGKS